MSDKTCAERVQSELDGELETLMELWDAYTTGGDNEREEFDNHHLSFDYVAPHTFKDQSRGYFRYQISWGGPSDEFRIYAEGQEYHWDVDKIEYWFLDWFDGAKRVLTGDDFKLLEEIFTSYFVDAGSAEQAYNDAMEDYEPEFDEEESDED